MSLTPRLPKLPAQIHNFRTFQRHLVSAAAAACPLLEAACQIPLAHDFDDLTSRVLRGHLVRGWKLYDATVALYKRGKGDVAHNLTRGLMELLINMDYLLHAPDRYAAARGFVCRSASHLLQPIAYLEKQVAIPEDVNNPTTHDRDEWARSIGPSVDLEAKATWLLSQAGVLRENQQAQEFLKSDRAGTLTSAWPASVKERAMTPMAQDIYNVWYAKSCLTLHLNWEIMKWQDLQLGDRYEPDSRWFFDDSEDLIEVTEVTLAVFTEQLLALGGDEATELAEGLATIVAWFVRAQATMHASI